MIERVVDGKAFRGSRGGELLVLGEEDWITKDRHPGGSALHVCDSRVLAKRQRGGQLDSVVPFEGEDVTKGGGASDEWQVARMTSYSPPSKCAQTAVSARLDTTLRSVPPRTIWLHDDASSTAVISASAKVLPVDALARSSTQA